MSPHKITWLNYLNYYVLRWFCIRLYDDTDIGYEYQKGWRIIFRWPSQGWE
jgi:hypothetical protein